MTGTLTKRVESGEATETTTKRMLAAVTEVLGKRITAAITTVHSKRIFTQSTGEGQATNAWGSHWGEPKNKPITGAITFIDTWGGSWGTIIEAKPSLNVSNRVPSGGVADNTKRVQETPQA